MTTPQPFVFERGPEVKRHAPATVRNRDAIAQALAKLLPERGLVLEIASGTGEHVVYFAKLFPETATLMRTARAGSKVLMDTDAVFA